MKTWRSSDHWQVGGDRRDLATIPMPIRRKWFDMIRAGVKCEEYRSLRWKERVLRHCQEARAHDLVPCLELINGYGAKRPRIVVEIGIVETRLADDIPPFHPDWGEQAVDRIAIHLGHVFLDLEANRKIGADLEAFHDYRKLSKPILDVACGARMFYFDKHDPRVLFCDIRRERSKLCDGRNFEVNPDIQCDFTRLPFPDRSFRVVIFDPPHLLRNTGKSNMALYYGSLNEQARPTGYQMIKYGALCRDWRELIGRGFAECFRVLVCGGVLIFKWNETDIKVKEILALTTEKPVIGHISGKRSNTHWIMFLKGGLV